MPVLGERRERRIRNVVDVDKRLANVPNR